MKRKFYPGEKWLYYKLYCNRQVSNEILAHSVGVMAKHLIDENIINKWFFVRYSDPDFHLRLRFCLNSVEDVLLVINLLKNSLKEYLKKQIIWKLQIDTYQREIERYGGECIESAEVIFYYDSLIAIDLLKYSLNNELMLIYGVKYINDCLVSFNFHDSEKLVLVNSYLKQYHKEFKIELTDKRKLNKYAIKNNSKEDTLNILGSIIHMGINRLFDENQRFYEMVCYDFLAQFYNSKKWINSQTNLDA